MPRKQNIKHDTMVYVEFYDPTFNSGWSKLEDYPQLDHALHIAVGIIVGEDSKSFTIAMAVGKNDKQEDATALNPLIILKSQTKKVIRFTEKKLRSRRKKCLT